MDSLVYTLIAVMVVGSASSQFAAAHIQQYLTTHDDTYEPPGVLSKMFVGSLFSTLPVVSRYRRVREENGQGAWPAGVFLGGFGLSIVGLLAFFVALSSL